MSVDLSGLDASASHPNLYITLERTPGLPRKTSTRPSTNQSEEGDPFYFYHILKDFPTNTCCEHCLLIYRLFNFPQASAVVEQE